MDNLARNAAVVSAVEGVTSGARHKGSDGEALVEALLSIEAIDGTSALEEADALLTTAAGGSVTTANLGDDQAADLAAEDAVYKALGRGIVEARDRLSKLSPEQRKALGAGRYASKVLSNTSAGVTGATRKRWDHTLTTHIASPVKASKVVSSKLRNIPSKIGNQVASDRSNFRYNQRQYSDAAYKTIAHSKLDAVLSGKAKRESVLKPEDVDLTSGSMAMHIAEAFLHGPVGQSLAAMEQEHDFSLQHQEFLNRSLSKAEDMQRAVDEADFLLSAGDSTLRVPATLSAAELRFNAATEAAKQQREENIARRAHQQVETQPDLPSGWELKNGGFVAEFGSLNKPNRSRK